MPENPLDPPRIITEREIYDHFFGGLHEACMDIAITEAKKMAEKHGIPIEAFDISALTFQHYKMWLDKQFFIKDEMIKKQEEVDKKFNQRR